MKRILAFLLSIFIGAILFVWIGESIGWREIKNSFLVFSGWHGLLILLVTYFLLGRFLNFLWLVFLFLYFYQWPFLVAIFFEQLP